MKVDEQSWDEIFEEAKANIREWRRQKPEATLTEIEEAIEGELARLQRQLVEEVANGTEKIEIEGMEHLCPACQTLMRRNGKKRRRLRSKGDQVIELKREQMRYPACGMTLFPPR
jgi:hypothetical protein